MQLTAETRREVGQTIRVFEATDRRLGPDAVDECLKFVGTPQGGPTPSGDLTMAVQALVQSAKSREAAASLVARQLGREGVTDRNRAASVAVSRCLDVALFDTYRQADSLWFDGVEEAATSVRESLAMFGADRFDPSLAVVRAYLGRLTSSVSDLMIPLLNSEHQGSVARSITAYLQSLIKCGINFASDSLLLGIVRRSYAPARFVLDGEALRDLRETAERAASERFAAGPSITPFHDLPAQNIAFRFLLLTGDIESQRKALLAARSRWEERQEMTALDLLVTWTNWVHETTLDEDLLLLAEETFLGLKESVPSVASFLAMATRFGDRQRGERWVDAAAGRPASLSSRAAEARFWLSFGETDAAVDAGSKALSVQSAAVTPPSHGRLPARALGRLKDLRHSGPTDTLESKVQSFREADPMVLYSLVRMTQESQFLRSVQQFSDVARRGLTPRIEEPAAGRERKVSLIVVPNHLHFVSQLPVVALERAAQRGAEILCAVNGMYPSTESESRVAKLIRDRLVPPFYFQSETPSHAVSNEWSVDYEAKRCVYKGVNYYYAIQNSLGIIFRSYNVHPGNPVEQVQLRRHLVLFQNAHEMMEELVPHFEPDREYRFVVVGVQFGLGYAIRKLVTSLQLENVRVVHASNGFEGFDPDWMHDELSGNAIASYHSVEDLTDHPNTPLGFRPRPDQVATPVFESVEDYIEVSEVVRTYLAKRDLMVAPMSQVEPTRKPRRVLMLGTILPDLSIPEDDGFAHGNIQDWVESTVSIARSAGIELRVKQHPSELNHNIGFYVSERFIDLLPPDCDHVTVLPYDADFREEVLRADLVILWSGTSVVELALMEVPYVVCSRHAQEEYPLNAPTFGSIEEYERILAGREPVAIDADARLRAVDLIHRTTTSPVREYSPLPKRQLLNSQAWPPRLDVDHALRSLESEETERLCDRLLGSSR